MIQGNGTSELQSKVDAALASNAETIIGSRKRDCGPMQQMHPAVFTAVQRTAVDASRARPGGTRTLVKLQRIHSASCNT